LIKKHLLAFGCKTITFNFNHNAIDLSIQYSLKHNAMRNCKSKTIKSSP